MSENSFQSGKAEAVILVKAAPHVGARNGETVCCAGLDLDHRWLRLYPIKFRRLADHAKFRRWDIVRFSWRKPSDDTRPESRRVAEDSLEIIGHLNRRERHNFVSHAIASSLSEERAAGRSLALVRPEKLKFSIEKKDPEEFNRETKKFEDEQRQQDFFAKSLPAYRPCPYTFRYKYSLGEKTHTNACQDWELDATFFNHCQQYGEPQALEFIRRKFGEEYPEKGVLFAMGTHSMRPDQWLLNGIIRYDEPNQRSLF